MKNMLCFLCLNLSVLIFSDPLQFDTSFNQPYGYAYCNPGITTQNSYSFCQAVALDQDDKILLIGTTNNFNQNNVYKRGVVAIRYLPDGKLDDSFNQTSTPGYVVTFFDNYDSYANSVAIQNDGKIVIAGASGSRSSSLMIARYLPDGQLDTSFNTTGFYIGSAFNETAFGVAVQNDGKILVIAGEYASISVYCFNSNGTIDTSFGTNGKVSITSAGGYSSGFGKSIVLLEDGSMVGTGYFGSGSAGKVIVVFKLSSTGVLDNSFADGGIATLLLGSGMNCDQIKMDALGKFVIGGTVTNLSTGKNDALVIRYTQNGILDQTFGNGLGYVITAISTKSLYGYGAIVFDRTSENYPGYGIFYINYYDNKTAVIVKYNYNGSLNTDFTKTGYQIIQESIGEIIATDAVMQIDQKLIIAGRLYQAPVANFLAMRFFNNIPPALLSNTSTEGRYGYNPTFISNFLSEFFYAQIIQDQDVRNAVLQAVNQIIITYQAAYASQQNFNYITNLYLINPYLLAAQLLLLRTYPDFAYDINRFFELLIQRIKNLA